MPKAKGMDAVLERANSAGKKRPLLRRKGAGKPGMAVMIAIGAPKKGMEGRSSAKTEDTLMRDGFQSRSSSTEAILAKMEARIAALEAKLAESEGEDEYEDEEMGEEEGEYEDEEA